MNNEVINMGLTLREARVLSRALKAASVYTHHADRWSVYDNAKQSEEWYALIRMQNKLEGALVNLSYRRGWSNGGGSGASKLAFAWRFEDLGEAFGRIDPRCGTPRGACERREEVAECGAYM